MAVKDSRLNKVERELGSLREHVLLMGRLAERILSRSLDSIWRRDAELACAIAKEDLALDRLDVEIDEIVLRQLALQSPVATDLRQVVAAKTMATDLERVGDLARNVAKCSIRLADRPPIELPPALRALANQSQRLLADSLKAYADIDADRARRVMAGDDQIDADEDEIIRAAMRQIRSDPDTSEQQIDVIFIAKSLERVADHATNIAEDVVLIAESRNIKHAAKLEAVAAADRITPESG